MVDEVILKVLNERLEETLIAYKNNWINKYAAYSKIENELQLLFRLNLIDSGQSKKLFNSFLNKMYKATKEKKK